MGLRVRIQATAAARAGLRPSVIPRALLRSGVRAALRRQGVRAGEVSLTLMADQEIAAINRQYLRHEGPTDVISFALFEAPEPLLGDIYIGVAQAQAAAAARSIPVGQELLRLAVHGILHVLGHDHPPGAGRTRSRMWRLQEDILAEVLAS
ncbi:MAG: rRNA maturation RNase YbeY [Gemmatimonadetes bacterium]|nr:rRNA maturation RNase YbeY [Gemmatimonadota bacterium]